MALRGVNLGGWLVLERWMTPSLFKGLEAKDETAFCLEVGSSQKELLDRHRISFISEKDFAWIAARGLNCVRIPIGHWIFGDIKPYSGSVDRLDWALKVAAKYRLKVIIDLHGAPGSQNGWDHSGLAGKVRWHKDSQNIERTVMVISRLAERYAKQSNLAGIELLNEPNQRIHKKILLNYYNSAYKAVRKTKNDSTAVIISDGFKPKKWRSALVGDDYQNVWQDMHLYQCFSKKDRKLEIEGNIKKAKDEWGELIKSVEDIRPVIIGEWSLGLGKRQPREAVRAYGKAQLEAFSQASGWFFWSYKMEDRGGWNFRHCVESGVLPTHYST